MRYGNAGNTERSVDSFCNRPAVPCPVRVFLRVRDRFKPQRHAREFTALETQGNDNAGTVIMRLLQARERLIGSILIGNNIVNIGASAFMTSLLVEIFGTSGVPLLDSCHVDTW